ncbi:DUF2798 domain-containing protein [Lactobacillus sp. S2-2]|uniref:DUF2798 domain-containing protein n=1 Tax=Lactobacillus sp. S2-2 TaxID=2692917 RepID=UPI001F1A88BF|nr:DUF2798 domain-containing protein [Lactobacillus sp. S2-2]MCF6515904.1 DUF2798 domain-containing protein [Lactobacillus sp. S2-2]
MPKNLKEELFFTAIMAGLMVFGMTFYNITKAEGFNSHLLIDVLVGYPLGLLVAVLLDLFLIGPIVKKIAFTFIFNKDIEYKPIVIGITISVMMVLGMVTCMSLFGIIVEGGDANTSFFQLYGKTWIFNLIAALPLQLLIVGPLARFSLGKIQAN